VIFGEILSVHLPSTQRPSRVDVASSTSTPQKKKKRISGVRQKHAWVLFPPISLIPLIFPLSLPFLSQSRRSIVQDPAPLPLLLPLRRASLSPLRRVSIFGDPPGTQSILFSGDPPGTQSVQFSGDPRRPVLWQPKRYTCFLGFFFFFILFGYVGERELLWGLSCFGV
jgi:hypothetical protein